MPLFGTEEWIREFKERANDNKEFAEVTNNWEGDFLVIVRKDGPLDHDLYFWIDLWHGKVRRGRALASPTEVEAAYVLEGAYSDFLDVFQGTAHSAQELNTGKFKVKGNLDEVLNLTETTEKIVRTMVLIDTEFY
jgi:putative sterol carrier protein